MITLEAADLIEGDASAANVVDFTINGVEEASSVVSIKALADGQLAAAKGTLYTTPGSTTAIVKTITLVNTDSSARTVNLYLQRDGSNSRRIIPEDLSLEADGGSVVVSDAIYVYDSAGQLKTVSATGGTHAILDGSIHTDSVADAVTRGSMIYGNATPKWDELVISGADTFLGSDGTDLSYRTAAQVLASLSGDAGATFSWNDQILSALKGLLLTVATELTIDGSGVITVTQMVHTVDTAGDASSDNLDTINGGTTIGLIIIRPAHTDRTVVVRDGQGNIELQGGADISLDDITDHMMLFWDTTNSKWVDFGGGGGVAAHAILDGSVHNDSVADAVTRGSIIYGNATPKWDELVLGAAGAVLRSDGTDLAFGHGAALQDADGDTKIQVEESADEDKIRMDVAGVEAFHLSDVGILDLVKQSATRVTMSAAQNIPTNTFTKVFLDTEAYDVQNEFNTTNGAGTAEAGTTGTTLHDDGVFAGAAVGDAIWNTTDDTYTKIASVTSNDEVECTSSIFAVGETFKWYRCKYTATQAGRYLMFGKCSWAIAEVVVDQVIAVAIYKNGANLEQKAAHTAVAAGMSVVVSIIVSLSAADYIELYAWHTFGSTKAIRHGGVYTSMTIYKLS